MMSKQNNVQAARAALSSKMRETEALRDQLAQRIREQAETVNQQVAAQTEGLRLQVEILNEQVSSVHQTLRVTQAEAMDNSMRADQYRIVSQNVSGLLEAEEKTTRLLQAGVIVLSVLVVGLSLALVGI